jgi:hypothetical protein
MMKNLYPLVISGVLIIALCFSACNRRVYYGAGKGGGAAPPPSPKVIVLSPITIQGSSRHAILDELFQSLADSASEAEKFISTMEVLEMCESAEVPVRINETTDSLTTKVSTISIRQYLQKLQDTRQYLEEIEDIMYNEEGKIDSIELNKPLVLSGFGLGGLGLSGVGEGGGGIGYGSGAGLGSAGVGASTQSNAARYGIFKRHFIIIAIVDDVEKVYKSKQYVLEKCESAETSVVVYKLVNDTKEAHLEINIRQYMEMLEQTKSCDDDIDEIIYNDDGKITSIAFVRE